MALIWYHRHFHNSLVSAEPFCKQSSIWNHARSYNKLLLQSQTATIWSHLRQPYPSRASRSLHHKAHSAITVMRSTRSLESDSVPNLEYHDTSHSTHDLKSSYCWSVHLQQRLASNCSATLSLMSHITILTIHTYSR